MSNDLMRKGRSNVRAGLLCAVLAALLALWLGAPASRAEPQSEGKPVKLRMSHFYGVTEPDIATKYLRKIIDEDLPQAFPDVELVEDVYDNETYKTRIRVLMAADELPDIMFSFGGGFSRAFFETGRTLPVDAYLDDFYRERLIPEYQKNFMYEGELHGICFSRWVGVLYCNRRLFEEAGAQIPETYDELMEACEKLRAAGIAPIACGMLNYWHGQQWINNYTLQLGGIQMYQDMLDGKISLNNPTLAEAAQYVLELVKADAFCERMNEINSGEAEELFLNGQAAMIYLGDWFTLTAEERLGEDLTVTKMPLLPDAKYPNDYHGGAVNGWIVSADTDYPELSVRVAAYLAYRLGCYLPAVATFDVDEEDRLLQPDALQRRIATFYPEGASGGAAWDTLMLPDQKDAWLTMCAKLFAGRCDGKGFALQAGVVR